MKNRKFERIRIALHRVLQLFRTPPRRPEPEAPGDPFAYVTAPKKPRPGGRSTAAVAEWPEH